MEEQITSWIQTLMPIITDVVALIVIIIKLVSSAKMSISNIQNTYNETVTAFRNVLESQKDENKKIIASQQKQIEMQQRQIDELARVYKAEHQKVID